MSTAGPSKTPHSRIIAGLTRGMLLLTALMAVFTLSCAAGGSDTGSAPTSTPSLSHVDTDAEPGRSALRCEECRAVQVTGVLDTRTVETTEGPVRLYAVFVAPQDEQCVEDAMARLADLAGSSVRLEEGPISTDSRGTPLRYVYTEAGDSIDEAFISEGIARLSSFEGQHSPWLLFKADEARRERRGCIWESYEEMFPGRTLP